MTTPPPGSYGRAAIEALKMAGFCVCLMGGAALAFGPASTALIFALTTPPVVAQAWTQGRYPSGRSEPHGPFLVRITVTTLATSGLLLLVIHRLGWMDTPGALEIVLFVIFVAGSTWFHVRRLLRGPARPEPTSAKAS